MASPLDAALVQKAVAALYTHLAKERAGKSALFEEEDMFSLVVALEKTPQHGSVKAHRLCVPAALRSRRPAPAPLGEGREPLRGFPFSGLSKADD